MYANASAFGLAGIATAETSNNSCSRNFGLYNVRLIAVFPSQGEKADAYGVEEFSGVKGVGNFAMGFASTAKLIRWNRYGPEREEGREERGLLRTSVISAFPRVKMMSPYLVRVLEHGIFSVSAQFPAGGGNDFRVTVQVSSLLMKSRVWESSPLSASI